MKFYELLAYLCHTFPQCNPAPNGKEDTITLTVYGSELWGILDTMAGDVRGLYSTFRVEVVASIATKDYLHIHIRDTRQEREAIR